jgi:Fic family protein
MNTLRLFALKDFSIPASTSWYLADLGEFRGKQALYTQQSPQRLKTLREHALIESAVSSNRIEGVSVDPSRVREVLVAAKPLFRDRDEEEVRGYRDALKLIHEGAARMPVSEAAICELHRLARGQIWDAGQYKEKDGDIIERYANGRERVRFRPVSAAGTPAAMMELVTDWQHCLDDRWAHVAVGAFASVLSIGL